MTTLAKPVSQDGSHWYYSDGKPCYELPKKDGSGMKTPTLADARKLQLLPSVTTLLKILHKQALVEWLIEQSCLALLTTPRLANEADDAFVQRVLHTEKVQDQEAGAARERGTDMHDCMEALLMREAADPALAEWVLPCFADVNSRGKVIACETVVCGDGYAGKVDLVQETETAIWLWDWKTTKKLPDPSKGGAWSEHRLQLAAYAEAWRRQHGNGKPIITANAYISTLEQGKYCICEHTEWQRAYAEGFAGLVTHWQWQTGYVPGTPTQG